MEFWKRNLYALWATEFLGALGMGLVLPFLPYFIRELGVTEGHEVERWSGLVYAAPFITSIFATPFWGWLGDRYGRRMMLVRALLGFTLSTGLMAFVQTVQQLLALRLIQGAVSGFIAATLAIATTTTPGERMGYAMGVLQTSLMVSAVVGPFLGGVLADLAGYRNVFLLTGALGGVAVVLVLSFVREAEQGRPAPRTTGWGSDFGFVFASRGLTAILIIGLLFQQATALVMPIIALFVEGLSPGSESLATLAGGVFAVTGFASMLAAPFWGKRGDHLGHQRALSITLLGAAVLYFPQALVRGVEELMALRFVCGLFAGGILPLLYARTAQDVPEERRGGIFGITRTGLLVGHVLGPLSGGFLASALGMRPLFVVSGALFVLAALVARRGLGRR